MLMILSAFMAVSAAGETAKPTEDDPIVCKRPQEDHSVGTRMRSKKVCMRKSEWGGREKHTQREPNHADRRGNTSASDAGSSGNPR